MNRKAIFITVRTGSTRLPNKSILKIGTKHTIEYVISSVKKSKYADLIVLCTTTLADDDILCDIAKNNGIESYRGSEHNKWERWLGACREYNVDFFANADGDDLFFDAALADLCFQQHARSRSGKMAALIDGQGLYNDVYGIPLATLKEICEAPDTSTMEPHNMVNYLKEKGFPVDRLNDVPDIYKKKDVRMTLDYPEDLEFFITMINLLGDDYTLEDVYGLINKVPQIKKINYFLEDAWRLNQAPKEG